MQGKKMKNDFTENEIQEVIKEYRKKCYHGTNTPIELDERMALYILGSRKRLNDYINSVHESHDMTDWYSEVKCPCDTSRFYKTRKCKNCEGEQYYHPAGRFIDPELKEEWEQHGPYLPSRLLTANGLS